MFEDIEAYLTDYLHNDDEFEERSLSDSLFNLEDNLLIFLRDYTEFLLENHVIDEFSRDKIKNFKKVIDSCLMKIYVI